MSARTPIYGRCTGRCWRGPRNMAMSHAARRAKSTGGTPPMAILRHTAPKCSGRFAATRLPRSTHQELIMPIREQPANAALALIFAILLLDVIGISMLYPIAAYLVLRYSSDAFMVTLL